MLSLKPTLHLTTDFTWDGQPRTDPLLAGSVLLNATLEGLHLEARLPHQKVPRIPTDPPGRVANLWEYDVVECFLVGTERYLEIELGPGGHFLALEFSAPRQRSRELLGWKPEIRLQSGPTSWSSALLLPWEMVPAGFHRINAFTIVGQNYLCAFPTLGPKPDFHVPSRFPEVQCPRPT